MYIDVLKSDNDVSLSLNRGSSPIPSEQVVSVLICTFGVFPVNIQLLQVLVNGGVYASNGDFSPSN